VVLRTRLELSTRFDEIIRAVDGAWIAIALPDAGLGFL
jgi:hypothetical protein